MKDWLDNNHLRIVAVGTLVAALGTVVLALTPFILQNSSQEAEPRPLVLPDSRTAETYSEDKEAGERIQEASDSAESDYREARQSVNDPEIQDRLADLYSARQLNTLLNSAYELFPHAGFRLRSTVLVMLGKLEEAEREFNLPALHKEGYPSNLQNGYYSGWNSLTLSDGTLSVISPAGDILESVDLTMLINDSRNHWPASVGNRIAPLVMPYQAESGFCCISRFLLEGYSPHDYYSLTELDLINRRFASAIQRLNLLRFIDWEGSFTEVEILAPLAFAMQGEFEIARSIAAEYGIFSSRYDGAISAYLEMAFNLDTPTFEAAAERFSAELQSYEAQPPFDRHDGWFEQPAMESWLASLPASGRADTLRAAWTSLKEKHGMADLYGWMHSTEAIS